MDTDLGQVEAYRKLTERNQEIALLHSIAGLLNWDSETLLPPKGLPFRADQLAHLAGKTHRMATEPEVGGWLAACEEFGVEGDSGEAANVREWRRSYDRAVRLPATLVEEFERTTTMAREAWVEARKRSEFEVFESHLTRIVELCRQKADHFGFEGTPYNALMEGFEPGLRAEPLGPLFDEVVQTVRDALPGARALAADVPRDLLKGDYPVADQQKLNREVAESFGFDFAAGRIDQSAHPFCSGIGPHDCRMTTRYDTEDFTSSLFGVMHETGHGLYDQGLRVEAFGTPVGEAHSLAIHESQSRLWENQVGRSRAFWERWFPRVQELFPRLRGIDLDQFWRAINRVEPSFIRVEADEVTYHLHIVLRFEMERKLIEGQLRVAEVPEAWNARFNELTGLTVERDADGCLQDIHWSLGAIGYFATYSLGTLNAAQLFAAAQGQMPSLDSDIRAGVCGPLLRWLRDRIHQHGARYRADDLMRRATGRATEVAGYRRYVETKYLG